MPVDTFQASVQYGDFKGSVAADGASGASLISWLDKEGIRERDEFLLGVEFNAGESHGSHRDPVHVYFLLAKVNGYDSAQHMIDTAPGPVEVRRVDEEMSLDDFFGLFKRFSITLSPGRMPEGHDYVYPE